MGLVAVFVGALYAMTLAWAYFFPPTATTLSGFLVSFVPAVWLPTALAVALTAASTGWTGVKREVAARLTVPNNTVGLFLIAALLPASITLAAAFISRTSGDGAAWIPRGAIAVAVLLQVITGAVGEELGWRGFVVPRLADRLGSVGAAWLMGAAWALWHLPAFFTPGMPHQTFPLVWTLLFIMAFGAFMGLLFQAAGQTILITIAAHLSLNITTAMGGVNLSSPIFWGSLAVAFWTIAGVWSLSMRRGARQGTSVAPAALS